MGKHSIVFVSNKKTLHNNGKCFSIKMVCFQFYTTFYKVESLTNKSCLQSPIRHHN